MNILSRDWRQGFLWGMASAAVGMLIGLLVG
jgi:predicted cobalt transporter CbtA